MDRDEFITKNHNLIYKFINDYKLEQEEYYGTLAIGLIKAVDTYDKTKGTQFSTYAYICMKREFYQEIRKKKRDSLMYCTSTETPLEENLTLMDTIAEEMDPETEGLKIISSLTKREKLVLECYLEGKNQMETANVLGTSHQYISETFRKIKSKYKRTIGGNRK